MHLSLRIRKKTQIPTENNMLKNRYGNPEEERKKASKQQPASASPTK
jgi:hypothetical protein